MLGLRYDADIRTLVFISTYFGLLTYAWSQPISWFSGLLIAPICWFAFIGAVATHNAMHLKLFHNPVLNLLWQCVLGLTYGHPPTTFIPGHNISHHAFTQLRRDFMRTSKVKYQTHFLNLVFFMPTVAGEVFWGDMKYIIVQYAKNNNSVVMNFGIEAFVLLFVSACLLINSIPKFILFFQIPHLFAQWFIVTLNLLQHDGCEIDSMEDEGKFVRKGLTERSYNTSRNFTGKFINFFALNNGYHTVHHFYPREHWSLAKETHERVIQPHIHPNLIQENMLYYIIDTFILSGKRQMYDGRAIVNTDESDGADIDWVVPTKSMDPFPNTFGEWAFGVVWSTVKLMWIAGLKFLAPNWSPVVGVVQ